MSLLTRLNPYTKTIMTNIKVFILALVLLLGVLLGAVIRQPAVLQARLETAAVQKEFDGYKLQQAGEYRQAVEARDKQLAQANELMRVTNEKAARKLQEYKAVTDNLRERLARERLLREKQHAAITAQGGATESTCDPGAAAAERIIWEPAGESIISLIEEADRVLIQATDCKAYVEQIRKANQ